MAKKIIGWSLMVLAIIGLSVVIGLNSKYIFSKDKYYSQSELDAKVEEAFNEGVNSNTDLLETIVYYKNECDKYKANVDSLKAELEIQKNKNIEVQYDLDMALESKKSLSAQVVSLSKQISDNELVINQNEAEIERLQSQITALEEAGNVDSAEIVRLNATINSLRQTNTSLQETNSSNLEMISSLNTQISTLNTKISELNTTQTENLSKISALNTKISQLNSSISYYETFIKSFEDENKVVLSFEYNGSIISIQVVNKGSNISISAPADTERIKLNGWKNDAGETVDFSTYNATKSEKFTADLTVYHKVDFVAFGEVVETQYVKDGETPSKPSSHGNSPNDGFTYGYSVNCYSLDNVNPHAISYFCIYEDTTIYIIRDKYVYVEFSEIKYGSSVKVGDNLYNILIQKVKETAYKKFKNFTFEDGSVMSEDFVVPNDPADIYVYCNYTYFYDVTYEIDGTVDTSRSQIIEENKFASTSAVPETAKHVFDGWYVDDVKVDISTYAITKTTKFVAKFIDKVEVKFVVDDVQYGEIQYVEIGKNVTTPTAPSKDEYIFEGWSVDGSNIVELSNYSISVDTVFTAIFKGKDKDNTGGNTRPGQREDGGGGSGSYDD